MSQAEHPELRVEYCGEEYLATPGTALSFGRSADIVVDDNRFLHRVLGEFRSASGLWWMTNLGSSIALTLQDDSGPSMARVTPGASMPLAFEVATLRFEAGGTSYEMNVDAVGSIGPNDDESDERIENESALSEMTTTTTSLPLTDDQFALLVALAAPTLRNESSLPTNRQIASELGWTVTKYNRKLDGLCTKLTKAGVAGLHGRADQLAKDRRARLAEHVVDAGIVRTEHLS
jgi:hypothetical protein